MANFTLKVNEEVNETNDIQSAELPQGGVVKTYYLECANSGDGWIFNLSNENGEGMSISEKNLFDMFNKEFKDNF